MKCLVFRKTTFAMSPTRAALIFFSFFFFFFRGGGGEGGSCPNHISWCSCSDISKSSPFYVIIIHFLFFFFLFFFEIAFVALL